MRSVPLLIRPQNLEQASPGSRNADENACTLRMYTLLRMLAPCLASALSRYHPGWDPTPRTPPPGTPHPPPRDPPPPTHPTPHHPTPPPSPASPSGRLFQVDGYSKWMVIPSAWLFRGVLLQLKIRIQQTRMRSDSVTAESIDCFGGSLYLLSGPQRGAACKDHQEHPRAPQEPQEHTRTPKSSPRAPESTPRAPKNTRARSNQTAHAFSRDKKLMLKFMEPPPQDFCCCTTRLTQAGRGSDRLAQMGRGWGGGGGLARRPERRGVGGRIPPPIVSKCSSTPDQGSANFAPKMVPKTMKTKPQIDPFSQETAQLYPDTSSGLTIDIYIKTLKSTTPKTRKHK